MLVREGLCRDLSQRLPLRRNAVFQCVGVFDDVDGVVAAAIEGLAEGLDLLFKIFQLRPCAFVVRIDCVEFDHQIIQPPVIRIAFAVG